MSIRTRDKSHEIPRDSRLSAPEKVQQSESYSLFFLLIGREHLGLPTDSEG